MDERQEKLNYAWQQWVCFKLGPEEFGVDILKVREIVRIQSITHVPQTPLTVAGVINLRGNVIPVIDLPKKLGLPESERDDKSRIIVFFVNEKLIGMIVDRVERVLRMREDQIEPPPDIGTGMIQEYITGMGKIGKDLIIQLNIDKILTEEEIIQMEDIKKVKHATQSIKSEPVSSEKVSSQQKDSASHGPESKTKKKPAARKSKPSAAKKAKS
ncbi:purine-binding chemotaxis protein CheW [bacterium]|nr:purine-binding chemotaxis protein CheW [bacterium]